MTVWTCVNTYYTDGLILNCFESVMILKFVYVNGLFKMGKLRKKSIRTISWLVLEENHQFNEGCQTIV
jgi:hypothetical protein